MFQSKFLEAAHDSIVDQLTDLLNRRGLIESYNALISNKSSDQIITCFMMDVDDFKITNDSHGHIFGDLVLQKIAEQMELIIGEEHIASRYGGEEFCIILSDIQQQDAIQVAEAIRNSVTQIELQSPEKKQIIKHFSISIGVTQLRENESFKHLLERADKLLYQSKQKGKNRVTSD